MSNIEDLYDKAMASLKSSRKPTVKREEFDRFKKEFFPEGSTVYLVLRKRAASGMQREIGLVVFKGKMPDLIDYHPNYAASEILGLSLNKNKDGVVVRGAGMDMGMHLVTNPSYRLYGNERSLKYRWL